uniref:Uncharacterized protein LOC103482589 n=1 Tax=Rhizophora mucronata TaxID=61149 RepID=A0A2P2J3B6_RHIMU
MLLKLPAYLVPYTKKRIWVITYLLSFCKAFRAWRLPCNNEASVEVICRICKNGIEVV